ncbi:hypothetical protein C5750_23350 [Phyllobacterium myrsinacearum]|uniref:Uncharacterized protein n=1 Tax=Phyllobacterium myrsinacearum TaxID=28101 RepID=A0A2S9JBP8_9HYPH|nr:hypothetical protein C5750_23350 [Phyllobacterium myrsinacearum]
MLLSLPSHGIDQLILHSRRKKMDEPGILVPAAVKSSDDRLLNGVTRSNFRELHRQVQGFAKTCVPDIESECQMPVTAGGWHITSETGRRQGAFDIGMDGWQARKRILHSFPPYLKFRVWAADVITAPSVNLLQTKRRAGRKAPPSSFQAFQICILNAGKL